MRLPDFSQDPALQALRQQMAAHRIGHFRLFDASKHLTGQERAVLERRGIKTTAEQLRLLPDHTLALKNGRVLVFFSDEGVGKKKGHFHLAACSSVLAEPKRSLVATTCLTSPFPVPEEDKRRSLSVCPDCLELLGYKGFSLSRNRRIRYSEQLLRHFQLAEFFRVYPLFPVRIEGSL